MLPSRRVTVKVPVAIRVAGAFLVVVLVAMLPGFVVFSTWPARPRTWMGWAIALLVGIPLLLLGEYAGEALMKRAPADPGRRVSVKRIAWLLAVLLLLGVIAVAVVRVQAQLLGQSACYAGPTDRARLPLTHTEHLACGILAHGFARVRCTSCGEELLVAFSCKGRGFCPSCTTRRMQGTATHLLDRVLPYVPMRQWVLSLPRWARFLLARDPRLITRALDIALRTIFSLQRRRVRRAGARAPRTGAVTFVQKFGGALNLNVHFHCVIPDGVFVRDGEGTRFLALSGPSDAEVQEVLGRIVRRLRKLVRPRSRWRRPMPASPTPSLPRKPIP